MKISQEVGVSFYQNFGKLIYAIAASDKQVHEQEYDAFKKILKKELLEKINSDYAAYALFQAEASFDYYSSINADVNECFNDFIKFKENNEDLFTKDVKKLVMNTAISVATAFSSKNKSELIMLATLDLALK